MNVLVDSWLVTLWDSTATTNIKRMWSLFQPDIGKGCFEGPIFSWIILDYVCQLVEDLDQGSKSKIESRFFAPFHLHLGEPRSSEPGP